MSTTVHAPDPLDPAKVGADTLATQLGLADEVFAANQQYLPQYADLALQVAGSTLPGILQQQGQSNTFQRTADINDVRNLGGQALDAWRAANPELQGAMGNLGSAIDRMGGQGAPSVQSRSATAPTLGTATRVDPTFGRGSMLMPALEKDAAASIGGVTPLQLKLQQQAMEQLGADLSPEELRKAQQDTRSAYAARGLYDSNQAIGAEILNTDAARRARGERAQSLALNVDQAGQAQTAANRGYAAGVANAGTSIDMTNAAAANTASATNAGANNSFALSRYGTEAGLGTFNAGLGAQIDMTNAQLGMNANQQHIANLFNQAQLYASQTRDPYQLVLGRSGAPAAAAGLAGSAGPTMFDPFNSSITSMYAANNANQLAANTATANNKTAMWSGLMNMIGNVIPG